MGSRLVVYIAASAVECVAGEGDIRQFGVVPDVEGRRGAYGLEQVVAYLESAPFARAVDEEGIAAAGGRACRFHQDAVVGDYHVAVGVGSAASAGQEKAVVGVVGASEQGDGVVHDAGLVGCVAAAVAGSAAHVDHGGAHARAHAVYEGGAQLVAFNREFAFGAVDVHGVDAAFVEVCLRDGIALHGEVGLVGQVYAFRAVFGDGVPLYEHARGFGHPDISGGREIERDITAAKSVVADGQVVAFGVGHAFVVLVRGLVDRHGRGADQVGT